MEESEICRIRHTIKEWLFDALNGRIKFSKEQYVKLAKESKFKCKICKCCVKETKFEIDHKMPLSGGGTNEKPNIQILCKACQLSKTSNEHETGQDIEINDTESTFNKQVQEVFDSRLSQTHEFVEKAYCKQVKGARRRQNIYNWYR